MKKSKDTSAYKTYALADSKKADSKSKTTQPTEDAVKRMRQWSKMNEQ